MSWCMKRAELMFKCVKGKGLVIQQIDTMLKYGEDVLVIRHPYITDILRYSAQG